MKILYIVPDLQVGGVTTIVTNLSQNIESRGHETYVLTLKPNGIKDDNLISLNILKKTDVFRAIYSLHRVVLKLRPDIIHSHTIYPNILALLYKSIFNSRVKIINTKHSTMSNKKNKSLSILLYKKLSSSADKISFVSKASMVAYIENSIVNKSQSCLVYNGVNQVDENIIKDLDDVYSNENIKFCFIGRIVEEKNLWLMIEAFRRLSLKYNNVDLYLIGDGILQDSLKTMVKDKGIENIFFLGVKDKVYSYIKNMDCILLSSLTESLPTIILESYAQKKIVISTDVGGVREIIGNQRFLSENNNIENYFQCLNYFYNLDEKKKEMYEQENNQVFLENFTMEKMIDNYEKIYYDLV